MAKKLTEEELEQDPLLQSYARLMEFYQQHKNSIISSAIAVIFAIALGIGYFYYSQAQEKEAQQLMGSAEQYYLNGDYKNALTGSEEDFTVGFEQIINNYSGTKTANLAKYYAAVCEYNLGNTRQALTYMNDFEVPEGILGVAPLSFKAVLHAELREHEKAAETYTRAAEHDLNESTTPYNYLKAAHSFDDAGNSEKAKTFAQKVVDEYPNSMLATRAQRLLGKLLAANIKE